MYSRLIVLGFVLPAAVLAQATPATRADASRSVLAALDARATHYGGIARQIWSFAELGYQEVKSSALLRAELSAAGFAVDSGVAGIPTAFTATFGSGKPVIGIVGEFDALPGLSQDASPEKRAIVT